MPHYAILNLNFKILFTQKVYFFYLLLTFILVSEQLVLCARGLILRVTLKIKNLHSIIMGKIF